MNRVTSVLGTDFEDQGLYLRGLVQLMAADRNVDVAQRERIRSYAMAQGFEERFIEDAMDSVLDNQHFPRTPPRFQNGGMAIRFLHDAARLALCDGALHPQEERWLLEAARHNDIDPAVVLEALSGDASA